MVDRYRIVHKSGAGEYVEEWDNLEQAKDSLLHWGRAYYIEDLETNKIYTFGEVRKMKDRKLKDEAMYEFVDSKEDIKVDPTRFNLSVEQVGNMLSISGYASDLIEFIYANQGYEITEAELENLSNQPMTKIKKMKDNHIKDVNPRKGESKEDFVSRFMSETKNEYPDNKQRYAVALSYWENKNKDKKVVRDMKIMYAIQLGNRLLGWDDTLFAEWSEQVRCFDTPEKAQEYGDKLGLAPFSVVKYDYDNRKVIDRKSVKDADKDDIDFIMYDYINGKDYKVTTIKKGKVYKVEKNKGWDDAGEAIITFYPEYGEWSYEINNSPMIAHSSYEYLKRDIDQYSNKYVKDRKSVKDDYKYKLVPKVWEEDDFSGYSIDKKASKEFWEGFWQEGMDKQKSGNRQAFLRWVDSAIDYAENDLVGYIQEGVLRELREIKVNFDVKDRKSVKDDNLDEYMLYYRKNGELKGIKVWAENIGEAIEKAKGFNTFDNPHQIEKIEKNGQECVILTEMVDKKSVKDSEVIELPHEEYTSYEDIARINEELGKKLEAGLLLPIRKDKQKIELAEPAINGIWIMWLNPNGSIDKITLF